MLCSEWGRASSTNSEATFTASAAIAWARLRVARTFTVIRSDLGLTGSYQDLATLSLPAGSYYLYGQCTSEMGSGGGGIDIAVYAGATLIASGGNSGGYTQMAVAAGTVTLTGTTTIHLKGLSPQSGKSALASNPDTGDAHATGCESYEPPPELSGLGEVMGTAIQEDPEHAGTPPSSDSSTTWAQ